MAATRAPDDDDSSMFLSISGSDADSPALDRAAGRARAEQEEASDDDSPHVAFLSPTSLGKAEPRSRALFDDSLASSPRGHAEVHGAGSDVESTSTTSWSRRSDQGSNACARAWRCLRNLPEPFLLSLILALRATVAVVVGAALIRLPPFQTGNIATSVVLIPIFGMLVVQPTLGESVRIFTRVILGGIDGALFGTLTILPFVQSRRAVVGMIGFFLSVLGYCYLQRMPVRRSVALTSFAVIQLTFIVRTQTGLKLDYQLPLKFLFSVVLGALAGLVTSLVFPRRNVVLAGVTIHGALHSFAVTFDALINGFLTRTDGYRAQYHLDRADQTLALLNSQLAAAQRALDVVSWDSFGASVSMHRELLELLQRARPMLLLVRAAVVQLPANFHYHEKFRPHLRGALIASMLSLRATMHYASHQLEQRSRRTFPANSDEAADTAAVLSSIHDLFTSTRDAREAVFFRSDENEAARSIVDGMRHHAMTHGILRLLAICLVVSGVADGKTAAAATEEAEAALRGSEWAGRDGEAPVESYVTTVGWDGDSAGPQPASVAEAAAPVPLWRRLWVWLRAYMDLTSSATARREGVTALFFAISLTVAALFAVVPALRQRFPLATWAPVTCAFVLQATVGDTLKRSVLRLLGTVVGAAYGHICHIWVGNRLGSLLALLAVWVFALSCFRSHAYYGYAALVGSMTPVVVMFGNLSGAIPAETYALARCVQTFLGCAIVIVVSFGHGLPWTATRIRASLGGAISELRFAMVDLFPELGDEAAAADAGWRTINPDDTMFRAREGLAFEHDCGRPFQHVSAAQRAAAAQDALIDASRVEPQLWREPVPIAETAAVVAAERAVITASAWVASAQAATRQSARASAELKAPLHRTFAILHGVFLKTLAEIGLRLKSGGHGGELAGRGRYAPIHSLSIVTMADRLVEGWSEVLRGTKARLRAAGPGTRLDDIVPYSGVMAVSTLIFATTEMAAAVQGLWRASIAVEQSKRIQSVAL